MPNEIEVMRADPKLDVRDIVRLIDICREERRTVLDHYTVEEEKEYIENLNPREAVFVARIDRTKFAGFAAIAQRWTYSKRLTHCGEVGTWVTPNYRRCRVGTALWQIGVLPWCQKQGFRHLGFFIMAQNTESVAFYTSLGFQTCGHHHRLVNWAGEFLDAIEMEMWLE
ncbi:MAG: GNAT family N-acetyltransferase [Candidatus Bathyarchaeota archaeon]|nr:MAG: GNAT family N-acetyltransferase [Candidatus Bathyarchaeota archaeon]